MDICELIHGQYFLRVQVFIKFVYEIVVFYDFWNICQSDPFDVIFGVQNCILTFVQTHVKDLFAHEFRL